MNPLQQGLKPLTRFVTLFNPKVAIMNPLQQGLKLFSCIRYVIRLFVAIMNPLQQGLKPSLSTPAVVRSDCCNNESTTTRIETRKHRVASLCLYLVAIMNPLQQGLKRLVMEFSYTQLHVAIMNPLQQGLKLYTPHYRIKVNFGLQ